MTLYHPTGADGAIVKTNGQDERTWNSKTVTDLENLGFANGE